MEKKLKPFCSTCGDDKGFYTKHRSMSGKYHGHTFKFVSEQALCNVCHSLLFIPAVHIENKRRINSVIKRLGLDKKEGVVL